LFQPLLPPPPGIRDRCAGDVITRRSATPADGEVARDVYGPESQPFTGCPVLFVYCLRIASVPSVRFPYCSGCPCNSPLPSPGLRQRGTYIRIDQSRCQFGKLRRTRQVLRSRVRPNTTVELLPTRSLATSSQLQSQTGCCPYRAADLLLRFLQNCIVMTATCGQQCIPSSSNPQMPAVPKPASIQPFALLIVPRPEAVNRPMLVVCVKIGSEAPGRRLRPLRREPLPQHILQTIGRTVEQIVPFGRNNCVLGYFPHYYWGDPQLAPLLTNTRLTLHRWHEPSKQVRVVVNFGKPVIERCSGLNQ